VPDVVRGKALLQGQGAWLDALPQLVAEVAGEWALTTGQVMEGGTEALVIAATGADGKQCVLKLLVPRAADLVAEEMTVLRLAGGDGCVQLLRHDAERGALLLERLGPSMAELAVPFAQRLPILCDLAARVWRPARGAGLPTGRAKALALAEQIPARWEECDRPCSEAAIAYALSCAERRAAAHDDDRARLVHGDVHQWNALRTRDGGFTLIDPDGLLAEPEYDLGVLMREDPVELMRDGPWSRARWLAARTGCGAVAIWEWGALERVSTGLLAVAIGLQPVGDQMLRAAEAAATASSG
jgi:streptomycin 6-kinase